MRLRTPSPPPDLARPVADEAPPAVDLSRARRRASWRTRLVRAAIAAAVLGVLGLATWVIGYSDLLTADSVEVRGVEGPLAETVRETAAVPLGVPLARVDTDAVAERVGAVPDVESVTASRSWPSTVVLTVVPRDPVATLHLPRAAHGSGAWCSARVRRHYNPATRACGNRRVVARFDNGQSVAAAPGG